MGELKRANGIKTARVATLQRENLALAYQLQALTQEEEWFPNIIFEPWGLIDQRTVDWCKDAIVKTGLTYVLVQGNIKEIRVGPDEKTDRLTGVAAVATTQGGIIYLDDTGWMPGWDLPGTILHEGWHQVQILSGLTSNPKAMEIGAYSIQQLFEWRYCELNDKTPRNLFKERIGAIGLM